MPNNSIKLIYLPIDVNSYGILADLDITQSGKAAPTLKHEHRVVICHLKLIDVMYSFIIDSFTVYSGLAVIDMLFLMLL